MQEHSQNLKEDAEGNNLATFIGEKSPTQWAGTTSETARDGMRLKAT
jgi:hypothetical protein